MAAQFAVPSEEYVVDPVRAKALELFIILHMDHEQNASTSTVRTAGSSQANPFVVRIAPKMPQALILEARWSHDRVYVV